MKLFVAVLTIVGTTSIASAQDYGTGSNPSSHYTNGYMRENGTYVAPHYQTNPNNSTSDNCGKRGNFDPYTEQTGRY